MWPMKNPDLFTVQGEGFFCGLGPAGHTRVWSCHLKCTQQGRGCLALSTEMHTAGQQAQEQGAG